MSGAFFRLSSGCLSARLRREQSRQQLAPCSFPRAPVGDYPLLRDTPGGPTCLSSWLAHGGQHCWILPTVGWGLVCVSHLSLVSFFRGLVAAPVAHFVFWATRGLLQPRAQRWAQRSHRVCSPRGARNQRSVTPCSSSRTGGRSTDNAFNVFNAFNACSRATFPFLSAAASSCSSCTFLPFRQPLPASSSCLRDSILADAQGTGSTQIGGFFKENHYS